MVNFVLLIAPDCAIQLFEINKFKQKVLLSYSKILIYLTLKLIV